MRNHIDTHKISLPYHTITYQPNLLLLQFQSQSQYTSIKYPPISPPAKALVKRN